ncbi:hypothetical protein V8B55DRAFT_1544225 [Mucor lusitanicus]|uniref:Uncharacterized protein n=2 Tax=Mucor TaxID=4830 RepID=A0A162TR90_MUCCL|nr:hypothetical protein HMPREF1544_06992 [Mucor circinelloides 1006PhL]KAG1089874.1 hypothetical protein G6F42_019859 [Rhizopus arrhizus]OAD06482.1 hypothetical protein MUCCIDRAFT_107059 [Mucor lusitanicus CBS 277.49]
MPNQLVTKGPLYWAVPLTLVAATVYVSKIKASSISASSHPLKFVPSGEPKFDSANMDRIRAEWRHRNNGIGLRDVSRSGGGV